MVFQDKKIGDFVNRHFVNLRVDSNKGEGAKIKEKYNIRGFPTVLFLDGKGEEIDRIFGFDGDKGAYFKILTDYAAGKNTLRLFLSEVKAAPDNIDANFKLAKKYVSRWEWENAQPYFSKVLTLDPNDEKGFKTESRCYLAVIESRVNKNIKPLLSFIESNTEEQFWEPAYYNLLRYYRRAKDTGKIIETFEGALKKMPENTDLLIDYARYISQNKIKDKYKRGMELVKKVIETNPKEIDTYMRIGYFYQEIENYEKAEEIFLKCLQIWPDNTGPIYQLGRNTVFSGKNLEKGLSYFREYLKHKPGADQPEWADAHWRMGLIYEKLEDRKQATSEYKKALELNPEHKNAREALEKLGS
ncbi:MAG: tetratricopeptide repeat protein [Candidatus Aminicenantes bacterium]